MKSLAKILLVEDDKNLGEVIRDLLVDVGYHVDWVENGQQALSTWGTVLYDLILLDVMLPVKDGFSVAEEIRKQNDRIPIIFITAKAMREDKVRGFHIGADDYLTKPFSTEEMLLRIQAVLRRTQQQNAGVVVEKEVYQIGRYTFDASNQIISIDNNTRNLTKKESALLRLLCVNKNQLVRRDFALKLIWGDDDYFMGRSMDVYITKLRKILKDDPNVSIQNIHRTGFKLEVKE
ncbi:MAG: response regulator transcription factor [Bacteroidales bacterium]|nr:response regulator transcription factor [Bacteroidales bacterium]HOK98973.1 response regulator transcription factor [Bacteroidales bacterium]HPO65806.1 response regulator transcription factor [Bacteroidales bacterium]